MHYNIPRLAQNGVYVRRFFPSVFNNVVFRIRHVRDDVERLRGMISVVTYRQENAIHLPTESRKTESLIFAMHLDGVEGPRSVVILLIVHI